MKLLFAALLCVVVVVADHQSYWPNREQVADAGFDELDAELTFFEGDDATARTGRHETLCNNAQHAHVAYTVAGAVNEARLYADIDDTTVDTTLPLPLCEDLHAFHHGGAFFTHHSAEIKCNCAWQPTRRCPYEIELTLGDAVHQVPFTEFADSAQYGLARVPATGVAGTAKRGVDAAGATDGCQPLVNSFVGAWCVVDRAGDVCSAKTKQENCWRQGAVGVVIVDDDDSTVHALIDIPDTQIMPTVMVRKSKGAEIIAAIAAGATTRIAVSPTIGQAAPLSGFYGDTGLTVHRTGGAPSVRVMSNDIDAAVRFGIVTDLPDAGFEIFFDLYSRQYVVATMPTTVVDPVNQITRLGILDRASELASATYTRAFRRADDETPRVLVAALYAGESRVALFDMSSPAVPVKLGELVLPVRPPTDDASREAWKLVDMQTSPDGSRLYVAEAGGKLHTVSLDDVAAPAYVTTVGLPTLFVNSTAYSLVTPMHSARQGPVIYFALGSEGHVWLDTFDVNVPRVMAYANIAESNADPAAMYMPYASPDCASTDNGKWWLTQYERTADRFASIEEVLVDGVDETETANPAADQSFFLRPPDNGQVINLNFKNLRPRRDD